ncbi:unnamed protein product [Urochloa humidicola]
MVFDSRWHRTWVSLGFPQLISAVYAKYNTRRRLKYEPFSDTRQKSFIECKNKQDYRDIQITIVNVGISRSVVASNGQQSLERERFSYWSGDLH